MENKVTEEIAIGSFWNFILTLSARLGSIFFVIIIARFLMPENFGIYTLAVSIALILLVTIDAGINQTLLKYVAEALNKKDKKLAAASFRFLFKLKLTITIFVSFLLILIAFPLAYYVFRKPPLFLPIVFSSLYILVNSIGSFYSSYFYIIKKLWHVTIKQIIFEVLRILGVLFIFLILAKEQYVMGTISVLSLSMIIAASYLIYNIKKISPFLYEKSNESFNKNKILEFSFYFATIGSLLIIFGYVDTIMLGIFLEASYVGYYSAALALVTGIWGFLNLSQILLPIMSEIKDNEIRKELSKVFKYLSILSIPAIFGIFILGKFFIAFIYGYDYLPAMTPFYVLSFLIFIIPTIEIITPIFYSREKPKIIIKGLIIATILNITLNYFFINTLLKISSSMALVGAAMATVISQSVFLTLLLMRAKKESNISLNIGYTIKPIIASSIMALILFYINSNISDFNIFIGIGEIFLGVIIYFSVILMIKGLKKEDYALFKDLLRKFF
ncbi:flippase [Candidatus Pacearchaeota archaeon]|nr:flippase [Candidatus Pacearchaeota archaeon]